MRQKILLLILVAVPLALAVKGSPGNISEPDLSSASWTANGPFELSVERGRFALTFSIAENRSVIFSMPLAQFAIPDLGYTQGRYVSLFAPAVSFLALPGYFLGKLVGASQVGAFATSAVFALFNFFLIRAIASRLGAPTRTATLGALAFVFATPAFAYAGTLYQHHVSAFLVLSSLYLLAGRVSWWSLFGIWFLLAASIPVDYPNLFLMLPIGLAAAGKIISPFITSTHLRLHISLAKLLTPAALLLPLAFFLWFNFISYSNPLQFSGTVASVDQIGSDGLPVFLPSRSASHAGSDHQQSALAFFNSRNLLNGLYIHALSPDRGIFFFTPIVIIGLLGIFTLPPRRRSMSQILLAVVGINITLYSLWGDPWGGWAFGSRYLIPAYAASGVGLAFALDRIHKNIFLLAPAFLILIYSLAVNALGAVTTNALPPQIEAAALSQLSGRRERFSFDRNLEFLLAGNSKSFVFQSMAKKYLTAWQYYLAVAALPTLAAGALIISLYKPHDH